jgi:lipopolysaccharide/colanic/teichoic acid biosynthesis glycosyltransferase
MKRAFDIFVSSIMIVALLPLVVPLVITLRLTGEGKVFYRQQRIGKSQKSFSILKFVTMLENSPSLGTGDITLRNDPRVLPVGRVLRKTKINELPQLWNVLVGDMSIVGPRPITPSHFGHYSEPHKNQISALLPGITGLSALVFRDEEKILSTKPDPAAFYKSDIVPVKAALETYYTKKFSLVLDMLIILYTIHAVLFPGSNFVSRRIKQLTGVSMNF